MKLIKLSLIIMMFATCTHAADPADEAVRKAILELQNDHSRFDRNVTKLAISTGRGGKPQVIVALRDQKIRDELNLTAGQTEKIETLLKELPDLHEYVASAGIDLATLNPADAEKRFAELHAARRKAFEDTDKKLQDALGSKKYARLVQLFHQDMLMKDPRRILRRLKTEVDADEAKSVNSKIVEAQREIETEYRLLMFTKRRAAFEAVLGKARAAELFGKPFVVDLPENDGAFGSKENPRRKR